MTINKQRVLDEFFELIQISCPSLGEREVADLLKKRLEELGGKVTEDMQSAKALNGTAGNLVADFKGTVAGAPRILLNAHMDCVNPCAGIKPRIEDGVIKSDGTTILGGDDKGGVVAILEALRCLKEQNLPHGDIQVVFSVSEEQGCAGAKNLDTGLLHKLPQTVQQNPHRQLRSCDNQVDGPVLDFFLHASSPRFPVRILTAAVQDP